MYARIGAPFNFLGHFSESQYAPFKDWATSQIEDASPISLFHRIRSQQLRKAAGLLEKHYQNKDGLAPTFNKNSWSPDPGGHALYANGNDHLPMLAVSAIKKLLKEPLQRQDEAVFAMNHLRTVIEQEEDLAQYKSGLAKTIPSRLSEIDGMFQQPIYQNVLVKDQTDQYKGQARYRTHQLDAPTTWEVEQITRLVDVPLKKV